MRPITIVPMLIPSAALAQTFAGMAPLPPIPLSSFTFGVAAGDLDGDGDTDAVVSYTTGTFEFGRIAVLLNNGDGVMVPANNYAAGPYAERPSLGDLDNDGDLDVVMPNRVARSVAVLRSNGNGTFQPATLYPTTANATAVALADFDGNGFLDIATCHRDTSQIRVLLGNGAGFPTTRTFPSGLGAALGAGPIRIAAGDLNGDGIPDIVAANLGSQDISIYYGSGNAFFFNGEFAIYAPMPDQPYTVELADMDNDGDDDIVTALGLDDAQVVWLRNAYNGGAEIFPNFNDGSWSTFMGGRIIDLVTFDLDCGQDQFPDVAVVREDSVQTLGLLTNPGAGALTPRPSAAAPGSSPQGVAAADFDNDGDTDIIACSLFSGDARVYLNRCRGSNCPADLAAPFGTLNFFDIAAYIGLYNTNDPRADFASPAGAINFFDIAEYISLYNAGCP